MTIEVDFKSQLLIHLEVKVKSTVHGKISKYKNISQSVTSRFDSIKNKSQHVDLMFSIFWWHHLQTLQMERGGGKDDFWMDLSSTDWSAVIPRAQGWDVGQVPGRSSGQGRVAHVDQEGSLVDDL